MPRRRRRASAPSGRWIALVLAGFVLFAAGWYLGSRFAERSLPAETKKPPTSGPTEPEQRPPARDLVGEEPVTELPEPSPNGASVALLIDDLGRSVEDLERLESLPVPLSYAVLPFESNTAQVVEELRRRNREMLCHLPMESMHGANPGPGALRLGMSPRELAGATREALRAVPGAVGVNNHMGSGLTFDRSSMEAVLRVIAARRLFFIDSRTSKDTVAYEVALSLGIPAAERQVFLDVDPRPAAVRHQFRRLLQVARERGSALAIGHPHPDTVAVLAQEIPRALQQGYRFVPASYLLDRVGVVPE